MTTPQTNIKDKTAPSGANGQNPAQSIAPTPALPLDITKLDTETLAALAASARAEKERREEQERQECIARAIAELKRLKIKLGAFLKAWRAASPPDGRTTVPRRYRNPKRPEDKWSGRGNEPRWLVAHKAAGGKLEDCRIPEDES